MRLAERFRAATPKTKARLTGAVYLAYFMTVFASQAFDAHSLPGRALNLSSVVIYALLTLLLFFMFRRVSKGVSLLAAVFSFAGCISSAMQTLHLIRYIVSPLIFFGIYCLLLGQLVIRSRFLPRILGALLVVAGMAWVLYLFPFPAGFKLFTEIFGVVAEGALCLWLLIAGVSPKGAAGPRGQGRRG